jgi:hypothetical protein
MEPSFFSFFLLKNLIILADSIQVRIRSTRRNNQRQTLEEKGEKKEIWLTEKNDDSAKNKIFTV